MKIHQRRALGVTLALVIGGCARFGTVPGAESVATIVRDDPDPSEIVAKLIVAHNAEREEECLPALKENEMLTKAAQAHADDMAKHQKMDHTGSNGSTPFERMEKAGYRYQRAGENIAKGQRGLGVLMSTWMKSEGHKDNILGKFQEIGVGRAIDEDGTPYWCVTFGRPAPR